MGPEAEERDLVVTERGENFVVARNDHVISISIFGTVTDPVSDAWRAATQRTFDRFGYPPFGFVDTMRGQSVGSLQGKLRSASFMRKSAEKMKTIALLSEGQGTIVVRMVMRAAGVGNVHLVGPADAARVLAAMKTGVDPFA